MTQLSKRALCGCLCPETPETPVGAGQAGFSCAREIPFSSFCLDLSFSSSLALRIAPRAQCGVINAAAAALCSDRLPPLPTLPLASARSLAYRRRLHIKNLYRLLRFVFELLFRRLPLLLFRLFRFRCCWCCCCCVFGMHSI